jgi:hypothetical protein
MGSRTHWLLIGAFTTQIVGAKLFHYWILLILRKKSWLLYVGAVHRVRQIAFNNNQNKRHVVPVFNIDNVAMIKLWIVQKGTWPWMFVSRASKFYIDQNTNVASTVNNGSLFLHLLLHLVGFNNKLTDFLHFNIEHYVCVFYCNFYKKIYMLLSLACYKKELMKQFCVQMSLWNICICTYKNT